MREEGWFYMFGYIKPYKPEMKTREYEQYRGVYCSLCKQLGKRYGAFLRFSLSYDMTFFALLAMALQEENIGFQPGRCSYNPTKKCLQCVQTDRLEYAADISALLFYYRTLDCFEDESFSKQLPLRLVFPWIKSYFKKAALRQKEADAQIALMMQNQRKLERDRVCSVDAAAEPFAKLLETLCVGLSDDDTQKAVLSRFGYCLGRYVYLADAADDMISDAKQGRYNPFVFSGRVNPNDPEMMKQAQQYTKDVLRACQAECVTAFDLLKTYRFEGILRNVLQDGITDIIQNIYENKSKKKRNRRV
jgi:hypothetical protein